jgi:hypothetical protein
LDDSKFAAKYGVRRDVVRAFELRNGRDGAAQDYERQRKAAKKRGIEWLFDLNSWMEVWEGKYAKRARGLRGYCMCRSKDQGPYAPWNVRIATGYENKLDWWEKKPRWYKHQGNSQGPRETRPLTSVREAA